MSKIVNGKVTDMDTDGYIIRVPYSQVNLDAQRLGNDVEVEFPDQGEKTYEQVKKCWAIMNDIADYVGYRRDEVEKEVHHPLRQMFTESVFRTLKGKLFRLSQASKQQASEYITFLLNYCLDNGVQLSEAPTKDLDVDEVVKYEHCCAVLRKCAVCMQDNAIIHHIDRVGMGGNRNNMNHIGLRCLPLCGKHHDEIHRIGDFPFMNLYHLEPLEIDKDIVAAHPQLQGKGENK